MEAIKIAVGESDIVSGLLQRPLGARSCYVFAHGAGAGMTHAFMTTVSDGLFERGIATLRFQFPFLEKGSRRADPPAIAHATVRAAVAAAALRCPELPLFAGGKSFGGRMTSQAQAQRPLPGVHGLAFVGFPLHPAGKPSADRAEHLLEIKIPILFLQGTRDKLAELPLIQRLTTALGPSTTLHLFEHADHSFHVPAKSGSNDREVMGEMLDALTAWMDGLV